MEKDNYYIKLISADGFEYNLLREAAFNSGTLRSMLSSPGQFAESLSNEIHLRDIKGVVLEKVVQYLMYKHKYNDSSLDIPDFSIEPEIALELLMASDFLDC